MSGKVPELNELSIQPTPYTTVSLLVSKTFSLPSDDQLEYEKWSLINYERLEPKSLQELLFEVIDIFCCYLFNVFVVGRFGKRSNKISRKMETVQGRSIQTKGVNWEAKEND